MFVANVFQMMVVAAAANLSGGAHVVDGDTLQIAEVRIRLYGVDAPELSQRCGPSKLSTPCGRQAAEWLEARIKHRQVTCSPVNMDRYGRTVATCTSSDGDLGRALVKAGWATAYRQYSLEYVSDEAEARRARRGIWAAKFQAPSAYRAGKRAAKQNQPPDVRCPIKGNISAEGARIYHVPGSRDYAVARIDVSKGERWFCSITEATTAGWRPPR